MKALGVYKMLINLRDKLTRLNGMITPKSVNTLKDELRGFFTVIKMHHYMQGQKYGHLASAIPETKYRIIINDNTWMHTAPADPGVYSQAAIIIGNAAALCKKLVVQHKVLVQNHANYLKVKRRARN